MDHGDGDSGDVAPARPSGVSAPNWPTFCAGMVAVLANDTDACLARTSTSWVRPAVSGWRSWVAVR